MKKRKKEKDKKISRRMNNVKERGNYPVFTSKLRKMIGVVLIFLTAIIIGLSFFDQSGIAGDLLFQGIYILVGKTIFLIPLFLVLAGLVFLRSEKKRLVTPIFLAVALLILGISGMLGSKDLAQREGGWIGYISSYPLLNYLGLWVTLIIFFVFIFIGLLIFWEFLPHKKIFLKKEIPPQTSEEIEKKKIEFQLKDISPPLIHTPFLLEVSPLTQQRPQLRCELFLIQLTSLQSCLIFLDFY